MDMLANESDWLRQLRSAVVRLRREARIDDQRQRPPATAQSRRARPGQARDDWEILRDLIQALFRVASNGIYTIEDVFREMSEAVPEFAGLTLSRISDLGVQVLDLDESPGPPGEPLEKGARARRRNIRNDDGPVLGT